MINVSLSNFNFDRYNYEVAFEFRDSGFLRRLFTRKSDYLVYYIRRDRKLKVREQDGEEILSSYFNFNFEILERYVRFHSRGDLIYNEYKPIYWNNPTEPQEFLTRVYMKLKPSQDNVIFSTASLSSNQP
jgi:hypothetical protein